MLHTQTNYNGLKTLYACVRDYHIKYGHPLQSFKTDQGLIHTTMEATDYTQAMEVLNSLRSKIFVKDISPLVIVRKTENELSPAIKWSLFKVGAIITYLISLCLEKEKKGEKEKKKNSSLGSGLALGNTFQKINEDINRDLEKRFPILETHAVKSMVDDTLWLYDRKNWIACGSAFCMMLLLYCIFYDKLPDMHHVYSVIIVA